MAKFYDICSKDENAQTFHDICSKNIFPEILGHVTPRLPISYTYVQCFDIRLLLGTSLTRSNFRKKTQVRQKLQCVFYHIEV